MPLSSPTESGSQILISSGMRIASLNQRATFWTLPFSSASASANERVVPSQLLSDSGEVFINGLSNRIGTIQNNDLRSNKVTPFSSFPDVAAGFPSGSCFSSFRSRFNYGGGGSSIGSIFVRVDAAVFGRSDDNGASWSVLPDPVGWTGSTFRGIVEMSNGRLWVQRESPTDDIAFSGNGGDSWTVESSGQSQGGASRRFPIVSRDGSRVVFVTNGGPGFVTTNTLIGAPVLNVFDLTAITGQLSGPGGGAMATAFDNSGGCFLVGDFGDFTYTPNFQTFDVVPDINNPLVKGDNVGATMPTTGCYMPGFDGFLVMAISSDAQIGAFFPREDIQNPTPIPLQISLGGGGSVSGAVADIENNIVVGQSIDNRTFVGNIAELIDQ